MIEIHKLLKSLARQRPIFHSEADFQHAFAWHIQQKTPTAAIRLELPFVRGERSQYLDIWASTPLQNWAFELKYKTRKAFIRHSDEEFRLKNHSAHDISRYAILKDVERLEHIVSSHSNTIGYCIFVTNDSNYWSPAIKENSIDADFRLNDKRKIGGLLRWGEKASQGTTKGIDGPITLRDQYFVEWHDFSESSSVKNGKFRYTIFEVTSTK